MHDDGQYFEDDAVNDRILELDDKASEHRSERGVELQANVDYFNDWMKSLE